MELEIDNKKFDLDFFEDLIEKMEDENGNFQISSNGLKLDENNEINKISIICVASHNSKYVTQELKERNESAEKFFPKEYSFNNIGEFDTIENLGDGESFYEFILKKR